MKLNVNAEIEQILLIKGIVAEVDIKLWEGIKDMIDDVNVEVFGWERDKKSKATLYGIIYKEVEKVERKYNLSIDNVNVFDKISVI